MGHPVNVKLNGCGTHIERIVSVHDLFRAAVPSPKMGPKAALGGMCDADTQAIRTPALHSRTAERGRGAAVFRRDEGCAGSALEVRNPPADHSARGARLHPPPAEQ